MKKTGIMTDSHSGILQSEADELGIGVLPMPFYIDEKLYREGVDISREEFYDLLRKGVDVSTSQPSPEEVMKMWDAMLEQYEELVYIPISSGLSGSCMTAQAMAQDEVDQHLGAGHQHGHRQHGMAEGAPAGDAVRQGGRHGQKEYPAAQQQPPAALQRQRDQRGGRACQHGQKARHKGRDQQINRRDGQREQARARGLRQPAGRQAQQGNVQNAGSRRRPRRGVGFDSPLHVYPPGVLHRGLYNPFLF